jgi:DNA-binding response OmpR family regulator
VTRKSVRLVDERQAGAANLWSRSVYDQDMPKVLIAEDDRIIANAMATHLRRAGMDVEVAEDGDRAMAKLRYERPDVAVLDLMLPGTDGWRITETLRAEGIETPIVIVSARGSEHDKVHALGIGGDDYLSKPFGMRELVARVEAVLRRAGMGPAAAGAETITAAGLVIDPNLHAALLDGEDVGLTPTEFRLLYVLAGERGRALSRDQLQQRVWGIPHRHRDRTVDVCVRKLRDKIDRRSRTHSYIQTHYGVGYRFDAVATDQHEGLASA